MLATGYSENSSIWEFAKELRLTNSYTNCAFGHDSGLLSATNLEKNSIDLQRLLNISASTEFLDNIPIRIFENAHKLFVYLNFCPADVNGSPWIKLTKDLFKNSSFRIINSFLSRVTLTSQSSWANKILKSLTSKYDLQHNKIYSLAFDGSIKKNSAIENWSNVHEVSNHPVHIMRADGSKSPSSFIPFCYFGENAEDDGIKIDGFKYPVCNMFKSKILNDQFCYEVDVNDFKTQETTAGDLQAGLTILVDYNEDRQIGTNKIKQQKTENELNGKDIVSINLSMSL